MFVLCTILTSVSTLCNYRTCSYHWL